MTVEDILERHEILPRFRKEFHYLANEGLIDDPDFRTRLNTCLNYKLACEEIMQLLNRPLYHFPEVNPHHYESLDLSTFPETP